MSHVQQNSGSFISVMPGARRLRIVVMMLIDPMIDDAPMMCTAKIVRSMPMPDCTVSGGYNVQPPEAPVVHPRERHVGRADLHRDQPIREADGARHQRAEDHDESVQCRHRV